MRDKHEILDETHRQELKGGADLIAITTQLRVLVEVLIDIRDQIPVLSTLISRLIVQTTQEP